MADQKQLERLKGKIGDWNRWREEHPDILPDLSVADLTRADLTDANLSGANLSGADLAGANLSGGYLANADLSETYLSGADLNGADLSDADLSETDLRSANLSGADLTRVNLVDADLSDADLSDADLCSANLNGADLIRVNLDNATIGWTILCNLDLRSVKGLETIRHRGPSSIGTDTILRSEGNIPEVFLRGAGLDDTFIDYVRSLAKKPIQYYSCFISYSSKDEAIAKRLHTDLQAHNVRCWFAPEDLPIGAKIRPSIDESIRLHDKLLLILSQASVTSQWVEQEVERALARERKENKVILFPIRLDTTVMDIEDGWPALIRNTRNIGDFTHWKDHDIYQSQLARLLRDLKATQHPTA